ncbi:hypothetical protein [Xylanibacillus composti]|uniref:Uncharacterized protein n=1 Tax=Xylanibacillus composti TaxID=1572762 RepID=A0A8J4H7J6_9BACL|nr:hypothetical protein [Xylanibacillus composti]GIQ71305.1 hypothetical protein XYCOK13_41290 [Xylanibacillus composti]
MKTAIVMTILFGLGFIAVCVWYINKAYSKRWDQDDDESLG